MNEIKKHISTPMGIHRLLREPYDDREVFTDITELLRYCKTGARYNGQKVSCVIGGMGLEKSYIQNFTINNDFPIIEFDNGEHILYGDSMVQIYYYNPCGNHSVRMFDQNKSHYNYLKDPFAFSILELIDIFRPSVNSDLNLLVKLTDPVTKKSRAVSFTQSWNPLKVNGERTEYEIIRTIDSNTGCFSAVCNNPVSGVPEEVNIIPKLSNEKYITEIYLGAPEYIKAAGVI